MFSVKKFSKTGKPCEMKTFGSDTPPGRGTGEVDPECRAPALRELRRLAWMLRTQTVTMFADFSSMMTQVRCMMAVPRRRVDIPRDAFPVSSFFCFVFLCESFHKLVGTHSRPLRGGKEGSVCRVM